MKGMQGRFVALAIGVALAACSGAASPGKTEKLADDGGDLGKAWLALHAAMKAGDAAAAGALLDDKRWNLATKKASWFQMFAEGDPEVPMGGKRNGDRATLFLDGSAAVDESNRQYRHVGATWNGKGWVFDAPMTLGSGFLVSDARDCAASPGIFPCGTESAPDGQVAGTIKLAKPDENEPAQFLVFDGIATRMVPTAGGETTATHVVLSTQGINPKAVALSKSPDEVYGWLGWPVMKLAIAPDGKSAELEYYGGGPRTKATVTDGLAVDTSTAGRIKGTLKTDVKDVGRIDVAFDLSTASQCRADEYPC